MSTSLWCPDDSFGPWAGPTCRGGFDFTLLFEDSILSILPSALFLIAAPVCVFQLAREPAKVQSHPVSWVKKVSLGARCAGLASKTTSFPHGSLIVANCYEIGSFHHYAS